MAAYQRVTMLFQITTSPTNRSVSKPHIAGWSESFWTVPIQPNTNYVTNLQIARARLLPIEGQIVGYRIQNFDVTGNRITPLGSTTGTSNYPGSSGLITDMPQTALLCTAVSGSGPNRRRFFIRGIPDNEIVNGEYTPDSGFATNVNAYFTLLYQQVWRFLARDLSQPSYRVVGIANSVITIVGPAPFAINSFIRLLRVKDKTGKPVKGVFRVTLAPDNVNFTVDGLAGVTAGVSGAIRLDSFVVPQIVSCSVGRAVVKKVGRPFEQYRGRRSKVTR
jgi:hypothetical protein